MGPTSRPLPARDHHLRTSPPVSRRARSPLATSRQHSNAYKCTVHRGGKGRRTKLPQRPVGPGTLTENCKIAVFISSNVNTGDNKVHMPSPRWTSEPRSYENVNTRSQDWMHMLIASLCSISPSRQTPWKGQSPKPPRVNSHPWIQHV